MFTKYSFTPSLPTRMLCQLFAKREKGRQRERERGKETGTIVEEYEIQNAKQNATRNNTKFCHFPNAMLATVEIKGTNLNLNEPSILISLIRVINKRKDEGKTERTFSPNFLFPFFLLDSLT